MNVSLTPHQEDLVRRKVQSGLYSSSSEEVREALRLLNERDRLREAQLSEIRHAMQEGVNSGPGGGLDVAAMKAEGSRLVLDE